MNPQSLNPYVYCMNNPLTYIDPDGRECLKPLQEMYGFDSSATLEDYALFFGIVSLFFGGGEIYFAGKATIEGLAALGSGGASTIGGILSHWSNTQTEALNKWLKEHEDEIEDRYWSETSDHYVKSNGQWKKITFKKDFFGNWDVETVDVLENELPDKLKNDEKEASDNNSGGAGLGGDNRRGIGVII